MTAAGERSTVQVRWRWTTHHARALGLGLGLALLGVATGKPGVVVLALPFLTIAWWTTLRRPTGSVQAWESLSAQRISQGQRLAVDLRVEHGGHGDLVAVDVWPGPGVRCEPSLGVLAATADAAPDDAAPGDAAPSGAAPGGAWTGTVYAGSTQWGRRQVGRGTFQVSGVWGGYAATGTWPAPLPFLVYPGSAAHRGDSAVPRTMSRIGSHTAARAGDGSQFADVREFRTGDRLRRIHWPTSARTGRLHVTTTYAEQDAHVVLIVDASGDVEPPADAGPSTESSLSESSLSASVRLAGSLAAHYCLRGDRVGLRVAGGAAVPELGAGTGRRHLHRMLESLALTRPSSDREVSLRLRGAGAGSLVVFMSPLTGRDALGQLVAMRRHGLVPIVIDTWPGDGPPTEATAPERVARRLVVLEREMRIAHLRHEGIPVVSGGLGAYDAALRELRRHGAGVRTGG